MIVETGMEKCDGSVGLKKERGRDHRIAALHLVWGDEIGSDISPSLSVRDVRDGKRQG